MAYPQYYPGMYNPQPMQMQMPPSVQPYAPRQEIIRVNGENGARAFQMAPNSNAILLDETAPLVWVVQTDGAGYKTVTPYNITPYQAEPPVDVKALDERIRRLEETVNAKSDSINVKQPGNPKSSGQH